MLLRNKARKLLPGCLVLVAAAAAAAWLGRDLPRRWLESALGSSLGAPVALEGLVLQGLGRYALEGLEIGSSEALPQLAGARIERVLVEGKLGRLRDGEVESLTLQGAVLRLRSAAPAPPSEAPPRLLRIRWRDAEVWFGDEAPGSGPLHVSGELRDVGSPGAHGELRLKSRRLDLPAVAAVLGAGGRPPPAGLEGSLEELHGTVEISADAAEGRLQAAEVEVRRGPLETSLTEVLLEIDARQGRGRGLLAGRQLRVSSPAGPQLLGELRVEARFAPSVPPDPEKAAPGKAAPGKAAVELETELSLGASPLGRFSSRLDGDTLRPMSLAGSLEGLPLEVALPWLGGSGIAGGAGELRLSLAPAPRPGAEGLVAMALGLVAPSLMLSGADLEAALTEVRGEIRGHLDLASAALAEGLDVDLEARLSGLAGGPFDGALPTTLLPADLRARGSYRPDRLEGAASLTAPGLGRVEVTLPAGSSAPPASARWAFHGADTGELLSLLPEAGIPPPRSFRFSGPLRGTGTAEWSGSLPTAEGLRVSGVLPLEGLEARGLPPAPWSLGGLRGELRWTWWRGSLATSLKGVRGELQVPPLESRPGLLEGALTLRPGPRELEAHRLALTLPGLLQVEGEGSASRDGLRGRLRFSDAGLAPWREVLKPLTGELASGLALKGRGRGELELTASRDRGWSLEGAVRVEQSGFSSADGARVLEGLESRWQVAVGKGPGPPDGPAPAVELRATGQVGGFQVLVGTFFGDFSELGTAVSLEARHLTSGADPPELQAGLSWQLAQGASLTAGLVVRPEAGDRGPTLHGTVDLSLRDLRGLLNRHFREPLLDASPAFERLALEGDLAVRVEGSRGPSGQLQLKGDLRAENLFLAGLGPARLEDFRLELPLHLVKVPGKPWQPGEPGSGALRFRGFEVEGLALESTEAPLAVHGDSVSLKRPLVLPVAGGRLVLEDLSLVHLLRGDRHAITALRLEALDLGTLSEALGALPLEGRIDGRLPRIRVDGDLLEVEGGGEVQVFGGKVRVGDISGQEIFSRYPKLVFSADFEDLDLASITGRFDVGEMSGVLQGSLRGCELFRSVLVRCSGRFETVDRPGVRRTISVKAVNNIAILGTGQSASFLDRGITRFLDRYTYSRLGVEMSLAQDVFLLRGLESRGDRELFLKGRLPFPIDVVNAQPGRTVSFQTMLRRLRSLDFGGAVLTGPQ